MSKVIAESDRLILRTWNPADHAEFLRHCNTPAVTRYLGGVQSAAESAAAFDRIDAYQRDTGHTFWVIERKSDGALLGFCGLKSVRDQGMPIDGEVEIGWRLREDAWGQGYAREAAEAAIAWGWRNLDVARIVAITTPANERSQRLMERLRMVRRPDLDFAHPDFPPGHALSAHITYVLERP